MDQRNLYSRQLAASQLVYLIDPDLHACEVIGVHCRIEGFEVGFGPSFQAFLDMPASRKPNIVIISEAAGNFRGLEIIGRVRQQAPGAAIFFVVEDVATETIVSAMKLGAVHVFSKPLPAEKLLECMRRVIVSNTYLDRPSGRLMLRGLGTLTKRESEVLETIADGESNKEIGRILKISPRTVEVHRAKIMQKLGARNTADLLRIIYWQMLSSESAATNRDAASPPQRPRVLGTGRGFSNH